MTLTKELFFGQGCLYICRRDAAGRKTRCFDAQDVSSLTISPSETVVEHKEHCSGKMLTDGSVIYRPEVSMNVVFDNLDPEVRAFFYKGVASTITAGSVTGENHVLGNDKILFTDNTNIDLTPANIVVNAVQPAAALVPATDYTADQSGKIQLVQTNAATEVNVDYQYGVANQVSAYTSNSNEEFWLVFDGVNLADQENRVLVDIYRVKFAQEGEDSFISEDFVTLGMNGTILFDQLQPDVPETGQYLKIRSFDRAAA